MTVSSFFWGHMYRHSSSFLSKINRWLWGEFTWLVWPAHTHWPYWIVPVFQPSSSSLPLSRIDPGDMVRWSAQGCIRALLLVGSSVLESHKLRSAGSKWKGKYINQLSPQEYQGGLLLSCWNNSRSRIHTFPQVLWCIVSTQEHSRVFGCSNNAHPDIKSSLGDSVYRAFGRMWKDKVHKVKTKCKNVVDWMSWPFQVNKPTNLWNLL